MVGLATAAALVTPAVARSSGDGGSSRLTAAQLLVAGGIGKVAGELPVCFNGAPGPCGPIVEGKLTGTPIRSGTFFAAIDDGGAADARRCVPATMSGLLTENPTDTIAYSATGRLCPRGGGGQVFDGRVDLGAGTGRFQDISSGRGRVVVTASARGAAAFSLVAHLRVG